jgi:hypothetical protein
MRELWAVLGLLVVAFADIFLVVLNYDEAGFLATRLCRLQWYCPRRVTRRLSRRWRPFVLRQVTGLNVLLSMAVWLGLVVIGFGFVYYGLMAAASFDYDGRARQSRRVLRWSSDIPATITFEEFSAAHSGAEATSDVWAGRFLQLNRAMEQLARVVPSRESLDAYARYRQWLPFAYRRDRATSVISRDLAYQPNARDPMPPRS